MKRFVILLSCALLLGGIPGCAKGGGAPQDVTAENESAWFAVETDRTDLHGETDQVTVTVTATVKKELDFTLGTSTFGREGAVRIECVSELDGKEYKLYDDFGIDHTDDEFEFTLSKGDSLTRVLKFSRYPKENANSDTVVQPAGDYLVRVRLQSDGEWIGTDVVLHAN